MRSPEGREVYGKEVEVEAGRWVSVIFEEGVRVSGREGDM